MFRLKTPALLIAAMLAAVVAANPCQAGWTRVWQGKTVVSVAMTKLPVQGNVYALTPEGIFRYDGTPNSWTKVGDPAERMVAAKRTLFAIFPFLKGIQSYDGTPGQWTQIAGGSLTDTMFGGGDGLFVVFVPDNDVWYYHGKPKLWTRVGGPGQMFAVGGGHEFKSLVVGISPQGQSVNMVYVPWEVPLGHLPPNTLNWTRIGNSAAEVFVANDTIFATNPTSGDIMRYYPDTDSWEKAGGPAKKFVTSGGYLYALTPDSKEVRQYDPTTKSWPQVGGQFTTIFGGDYGRVFATGPTNGDLWMYEP
ncbi:MAG: hypothetical protein ACLQU5_19700 [Isosphaeraceae bacterium]